MRYWLVTSGPRGQGAEERKRCRGRGQNALGQISGDAVLSVILLRRIAGADDDRAGNFPEGTEHIRNWMSPRNAHGIPPGCEAGLPLVPRCGSQAGGVR